MMTDIGIKSADTGREVSKIAKKALAGVFYGQPHFNLATVSAVGRSENLGGQVVI